jgi:hypothetical protein
MSNEQIHIYMSHIHEHMANEHILYYTQKNPCIQEYILT